MPGLSRRCATAFTKLLLRNQAALVRTVVRDWGFPQLFENESTSKNAYWSMQDGQDSGRVVTGGENH